MDFSACPGDDAFGPTVQGCRGDFDFTLKFEMIFFSLIPASVFFAIALTRTVYLSRLPVVVGGLSLKVAKLVC